MKMLPGNFGRKDLTEINSNIAAMDERQHWSSKGTFL
jgi:hypothetical protein